MIACLLLAVVLANGLAEGYLVHRDGLAEAARQGEAAFNACSSAMARLFGRNAPPRRARSARVAACCAALAGKQALPVETRIKARRYVVQCQCTCCGPGPCPMGERCTCDAPKVRVAVRSLLMRLPACNQSLLPDDFTPPSLGFRFLPANVSMSPGAPIELLRCLPKAPASDRLAQFWNEKPEPPPPELVASARRR